MPRETAESVIIIMSEPLHIQGVICSIVNMKMFAKFIFYLHDNKSHNWRTSLTLSFAKNNSMVCDILKEKPSFSFFLSFSYTLPYKG